MKLIQIHDTPFFFEARDGFPVSRDNKKRFICQLGRDGALRQPTKNTSGVTSIPVSTKLADSIQGTRLLKAGLRSVGRTLILVPESDRKQLRFPADACLVSAGYNSQQTHVNFESSDAEVGVIFSHAPLVTGNWSRRSFIAAMRPGTLINAVIQRGERQERVPLLQRDEDGTFRFLYTELPLVNFDSDDSWMNSLNPRR